MTANALGYAINTYAYTLSHTAEACFEHLADRGFREFELMMYPGHAWPPDMDRAARDKLKKLLAERGLGIRSLNMPNVDINVAGAALEMREYSLSLLKGVVELAGDLEVPGVVVGPGKANPLFPAPTERLVGYFYEALDVLAPLADSVGTALWVENMPFSYLPEVDGMMRVIERYGDDRLGVVYDLANGVFAREDLAIGLRRVRERLKLVHLSDTPLDTYKHAPVGQGVVDFASVVSVLQEIGYDGPPMLEIISDTPDDDIAASASALDDMGWDRIARP